MSDPFLAWHDALEKRHLATLTFQEVRRSVQALSAIYVEQRDRLDSNAVFSGAGKRAAFAMFYGPLHFLLIREIVKGLGAAQANVKGILDLGCGTGVAGAAWSLEFERPPVLTGIDRNAWALEECRWTYRALHLEGTARTADVRKFAIPPRAGVVAAFTINELDDESRARFLDHFCERGQEGSPVLIIEPIARRLTRWWDDWAIQFKAHGGREDQWRFNVDLPEKLKLMDRAAGLDHRELTGRSLWLPAAS